MKNANGDMDTRERRFIRAISNIGKGTRMDLLILSICLEQDELIDWITKMEE